MTNEAYFYTKYAVALTFLLKDHPQAVLILQYILWRKGAETNHADRKWHFQVADIGKRLGKDDRTVRKHLKPLVELGLLRLCGEAGKQYYQFDDQRYAEILRTDPRSLMDATCG
jgi:DNA-binding transcriptional ArsR family regulator